jgi:hypothetical protein
MTVGAEPHLRRKLRGLGGEGGGAVYGMTSAHSATGLQHWVDKCSTRGLGSAQGTVVSYKKKEKKEITLKSKIREQQTESVWETGPNCKVPCRQHFTGSPHMRQSTAETLKKN